MYAITQNMSLTKIGDLGQFKIKTVLPLLVTEILLRISAEDFMGDCVCMCAQIHV